MNGIIYIPDVVFYLFSLLVCFNFRLIMLYVRIRSLIYHAVITMQLTNSSTASFNLILKKKRFYTIKTLNNYIIKPIVFNTI